MESWDAPPAAVLPLSRERMELPVVSDEVPKGRRKRKRRTVLIVVALWAGFMGMLVLVGRHFWRPPAQEAFGKPADRIRSADSYLEEKLINDNLAAIYRSFHSHVVAANNEQRAQTVLDPIRIAPRMVRFFGMNPLTRLDAENMVLRSSKVLRVPEGDVVEVLWMSGDRVYDTAFMRQDGEWRLDWEHFVRYSDFPLSLFLAGSGPDEAEFRLFARERLAEERRNEPDMSVVLYSAAAGRPREAGAQTPAFLVPRESLMGKRLASAFQQAREGRRPFGSRLQVEEPGDLIRVRVRIHRKEVDGVRFYEITDVPACHWYGMTGATGLTEEETEGKPAQ